MSVQEAYSKDVLVKGIHHSEQRESSAHLFRSPGRQSVKSVTLGKPCTFIVHIS